MTDVGIPEATGGAPVPTTTVVPRQSTTPPPGPGPGFNALATLEAPGAAFNLPNTGGAGPSFGFRQPVTGQGAPGVLTGRAKIMGSPPFAQPAAGSPMARLTARAPGFGGAGFGGA